MIPGQDIETYPNAGDFITERIFRAPGLRTKHFERYYLSFNQQHFATFRHSLTIKQNIKL